MTTGIGTSGGRGSAFSLSRYKCENEALINACSLTEIAEGAAPEVEVESEAVGAVGDLGGVRGALGHVLGAVVDRVGEGVGAVDGAVRRADGRLPHEALRA